ncbi:MAG: hypothetical protein A3G37_00030 [Omnitrophica WOR_2 bacterium RIFCSPLOWO2_12_FULL_46_30]|nr:MAG: hypothetical protein A3H41_02770 [Omnitrophica WOR_2 bacterium RIFCSPLOWO2_02_FULL_45_28]OGX52554.1 MAG: hypothetical protein A3G37_00030 [Omnitrophica WOR_2 bacterium RIFCSPLOWO2_12_FULL_46_30]
MSKRLKKITLALLAAMIGISCVWHYAYGTAELKYFPFNKKDTLKEWKEKIFHGRVLYEVKPESPKGYLSARSDKASSGLYYQISFSPKRYPYISWSWKVGRFPSKAQSKDISKKSWIERDDYAVRVYVIFPAFIFTNTRCIEYIWAEGLPRGTVLTSPFYKNIKLIILESGSEKLGEWVLEERNIADDYRLAFGKLPGGNVGAIALMSDADNTQSSCEGYYADIKVGYPQPILQPAKVEEERKLKPKKGISEFLEYIKRMLRWVKRGELLR